MPSRRLPSRRSFLGGALRAGGGLLGAALVPRSAAGAPALVTAESGRPAAPYGAAVGDVTGDRAIVWSRCDRPARLLVEWSTRESFADARRVPGAAAVEANGLTARLDLEGLPPGQRIVYRVLFQDLARPADLEPAGGGLVPHAPRRAPRDVRLAWSADTVRAGLGHRRGARRHAHLRDDAPGGPGPVRPLRRHDLRRRAARRRGHARRRERVAQRRDAGQVEGGGDARRVPRQPPLQPARRERASLQRPRCPRWSSGTTTRW